MDARRTILVAALVVLAGCSGLTGGAGSEPTRTPTSDVTAVPVTDTESPTDTESAASTPPESLPPGVFANGTVDTGVLAWTHDDAVANRSYTWSFELTRHVTDPVVVDDTTRLTVTRDADAFLVDQPAPDGTDDRALYVASGTGYLAYLTSEEPTVLRTDDAGEVDRYDYSTRLLIRYMTGPEFDVKTVERDGRVFYRLYTQSGPLPRATSDLGGTLSNVSVTAYVTPEGFVRTLAVRYDSPAAGPRERVTIRYDYTEVGETNVTEPEWLRDADPGDVTTPAPLNGTETAANGTTTDGETDVTATAPG